MYNARIVSTYLKYNEMSNQIMMVHRDFSDVKNGIDGKWGHI